MNQAVAFSHMATNQLNLTLKVWRQRDADAEGRIETLQANNIPITASFLEMLDIVNEELVDAGKDPIAFDHDCREGICGTCALTINGRPHGPGKGVTTCQVHMRSFRDGDTIWVEPFRAQAFPVVKDLMVDRSVFDCIIQAGGFISARAGSAVDANAVPIPKPVVDAAFDAAACIGCGACVAACKNASAMLFVAAKVQHLGLLPQGKAEKDRRVLGMVRSMDDAGFGNCSNQYECEAVCPKEISVGYISAMNRDFAKASLKEAIGSEA